MPTRLISHSWGLPSGNVLVSQDQITAGTGATPQGVRSTSFVSDTSSGIKQCLRKY